MKSFQPATLTPTGEVAPLRKRRKERRRSPGNGLHFSSGCHGPPNGGDKRLIFEQGPLWLVGSRLPRASRSFWNALTAMFVSMRDTYPGLAFRRDGFSF